MNSIKSILAQFMQVAFAIVLLALCGTYGKRKKTELIWGTTPIINNKYWSQALKASGWKSKTLVSNYYEINKKSDFDAYFIDLVPRWLRPRGLRHALAPIFAMQHILMSAAVVHLSFDGGPLGKTFLWKLEAPMFKRAGVRTVVIAYGSDVFLYSQILDPVVRNGMLLSYPRAGRFEEDISRRVRYWTRQADVIVGGFNLDGLGRWDVPVGNSVAIDTTTWLPKTYYSDHDGSTGTVTIIHAPNHRGAKGTEFIINAVETLKSEGLDVELMLLERLPNEEVRRRMQEADILADQCILPGYGLNAIEGMASGLPVVVNLEGEEYTRIFRQYSFLDEAPLVSASASTVTDKLRWLVINPMIRAEIGGMGRLYVEKYHSFETAQYLFGSIYDRILFGHDVDLMNLYHPLKSAYNRRPPHVRSRTGDHQLGFGIAGKTWENAPAVPNR